MGISFEVFTIVLKEQDIPEYIHTHDSGSMRAEAGPLLSFRLLHFFEGKMVPHLNGKPAPNS